MAEEPHRNEMTSSHTTSTTSPPSPPPESLPSQALSGVKHLLGLDKKKLDGQKHSAAPSVTSTASVRSAPYVSSPVISPLAAPKPSSASTPAAPHSPTSPTSPRFPTTTTTTSPNASSTQIFERSVQDPPLAASQNTSIPTHITTEDYIPPVLEASSLAITDDTLDPDEVEIVTKIGHVPLVVAGSNSAAAAAQSLSSVHSRSHSPEPIHHTNPHPQSNSPYAGSDVSEPHHDSASSQADRRRLSFISFADVVQSEQAEAHRQTCSPDSGSGSKSPRSHRSISPTPPSPPQQASILPPVPSTNVGSIGEALGGRGRSPSPSVGSASGWGSGGRRTPGSPGLRAEERNEGLNVETLGTALRRTGSGDLGGEGF